jgi:DNA (cytosine-5)-methyltransferase 1
VTLTVGSLFSGIGGIDLGLERAGMEIRWQCENDPYRRRILDRHWPDIPNLGDVTTVDWDTVEPVDLICGGYPCQPFSLAGQRGGDHDPRHLWPRFVDALRVLRPRYACLENVPGHLSLGFGRVLGDLAENGYDTEWECVSAAAVGAPHLRNRVFVVAHTTNPRLERRIPGGSRTDVADTDTGRRDRRSRPLRSGRGTEPADSSPMGDPHRPPPDPHPPTGRPRGTVGEPGRRTVEPDVRGMADGSAPRLDRNGTDNGPWHTEWTDVPRTAHGIPHRKDRLRALGNAVVPQVAEWVAHNMILPHERTTT